MRRKRSRIAWSLGLITVFLLASEAAVRYFQAAVPPPADAGFVDDPATGFRLKPSSRTDTPATTDLYVNAAGFRDAPLPAAKPPGVFRVVALGDSHVAGGAPAAETFLDQAAEQAAARAPAGAAVEIVKLGCPGWQTEHETGALRAVGLPLAPDLVVLCFCVGTDISGRAEEPRVIQGNLHFVGMYDVWLNALRKSRLFVLGEQVYLWRVMKRVRGTLARLDALAHRLRGRAPAPTGTARLATDARTNTEISREYARVVRRRLPMYETTPPDWLERYWRDGLAALADFDAVCREAGVPWLLLVVPDEIQIDPAVRRAALARLGRDPAGVDPDLPRRRLAAWAAAHDVAILDPTAELRAATLAHGPQYLVNNPHWNADGSRLVGRLLAGAILRRLSPS